uniref:Uncharacterized protein n=1 Tax=Glossina palpalis gambiensis TaxID=67801 RepID=A0A1B0B6B0_9MUSC
MTRESSVLNNPFIEEIPTFLERLAPKCWAASISVMSLPSRSELPSGCSRMVKPSSSPLREHVMEQSLSEPSPPSLPTRVRKIPSRLTSAAAPLPSPLTKLYAKHSLRSLCLGLKLIVLLTSFIIFLIKLLVLFGTAGFVTLFRSICCSRISWPAVEYL